MCGSVFSSLIELLKNISGYFDKKKSDTDNTQVQDLVTSTSGDEVHHETAAAKDSKKDIMKNKLASESVFYKREWIDLPLRMKKAHGVFHNGSLYIGGGFTGSSKTDAVVYVHNFDPSTPSVWNPLPPSPLKWSTLSVFNNQLVMIGGKAHPNPTNEYTNKVVVWNAENKTWSFSLPSLKFSRLSPIVISHGDYLIVAGGNKGVLDYHVEVLSIKTMQWFHGLSLPLPCFANSSTVMDGKWYLMDQESGKVFHACIDVYIEKCLKILGKEETPETTEREPLSEEPLIDHEEPLIEEDSPKSIWTVLGCDPTTASYGKSLRLFSMKPYLLVFSDVQDLYIYRGNSWEKVEGKFPSTMSTGSWVDNEQDENAFLLLGGEIEHKYSNKAYKLTLMTSRELAAIKKSRQIRISVEA